MFVLRTGLQGNSKTLNTIKEVDTKASGMDKASGSITKLGSVKGN